MSDYPRITKPTKAGWYWYRGRRLPSVWYVRRVIVDDHGLWSPHDGDDTPIDELPGEWRGPIPDPTS